MDSASYSRRPIPASGDERKGGFRPRSPRVLKWSPDFGPGDDWLERQAEALLPIPYFHLVFALPHELNPLIQRNQAVLDGLPFSAATATLIEFGQSRLQAQIGVTAVLHTWSQTFLDHYHLHCIITGGGLDMGAKNWRAVSARWLFPVRALSIVYRAKFRDGLQSLFDRGELQFDGPLESLAPPTKFGRLVRKACRLKWVVYAKRPFAGREAVLACLSRYTHRVGITNKRILALDEESRTVSFAYRDYADESRRKVMTLASGEFVRRFCLHILPPRFVKIRHYDILSSVVDAYHPRKDIDPRVHPVSNTSLATREYFVGGSLTGHFHGELPSDSPCAHGRRDTFPCKPSRTCGSAAPSNGGLFATAVESR